jgi:hypothetical protein
MQAHGYGVVAEALDRFAQDDLATIDFVTLLLQAVSNIHRSD